MKKNLFFLGMIALVFILLSGSTVQKSDAKAAGAVTETVFSGHVQLPSTANFVEVASNNYLPPWYFIANRMYLCIGGPFNHLFIADCAVAQARCWICGSDQIILQQWWYCNE
jgi:hypothetical protein